MMNQRLQFAAVYLSRHPERPRKLKPKPRAKESQRQKQKGTQEPNQSHRPRGRGHHHAMIIRMEMAVAMMTTRTWMKMKVQEMVERLMVRQLLFLKSSTLEPPSLEASGDSVLPAAPDSTESASSSRGVHQGCTNLLFSI